MCCNVLQVPVSCAAQSEQCCLCCVVGPVNIEATLERSAYCCGEKIKLKYEIQNGGEENAWVICRLIQVRHGRSGYRCRYR